jgi:hypothetical protein
MRTGIGPEHLDRRIPADSNEQDPLTMPKIPIVNSVINLNEQKVRQAAFVVNSPNAWLPEPEIIGQRPKRSGRQGRNR